MVAETLCNYNDVVQEICESITRRNQQSEDNDCVKSSTTQFYQRYVHKAASWTGDECMENIIKLSNNIPGYSMSYFQREFSKEMLQCFSPLIFRNAPAHELALHLKKYAMEAPEEHFVFCGTARRGGKTDTMTITAGAMLASVPNINLLYFSLFSTTCELACTTTFRWLQDWGFGSKIKKRKQQIRFYGDTPGDVRTLNFINGQNKDVSSLTGVFDILMQALLIGPLNPPPYPPIPPLTTPTPPLTGVFLKIIFYFASTSSQKAPHGKCWAMTARCMGVSEVGNMTVKSRCRSPLSLGSRATGMPSPLMVFR
jgi:hypothetical protein